MEKHFDGIRYPVRLRNVLPEGGLIPQLDVIIQRVYPKLYMETVKDENGDEVKITRSEKDEQIEEKANQVNFHLVSRMHI